ncbi:MAG: hypothetical protein ACRDOB_25935, partial [Streptosporangiaceae bacterium]
MSQSFAVGGAAAQPAAGAPRVGEQGRLAVLDLRRKLQLALAVSWLLDGVLQYQPFMFSRAFPQMLAGTSSGNPAVVASPITWSATFIDHHLVPANAIFATIQLALGLGIAWRPTVKLALGASVVWALGVWWFGEGLGSVLTGNASPLNGAPGAVILYALLAVLLWPADRDPAAPFVAGRAVGRGVARGLWLVLWASLAFFALQPAARAPRAISGMISGLAAGQPGWLAWIYDHAGSALGRPGLLASIVLAVALVVVAVGPYLPTRMARAAVVLAIVLAVVIWLAEGLGGLLTGGGTDPNSGPLLALLAIAFWPAVRSPAALSPAV